MSLFQKSADIKDFVRSTVSLVLIATAVMSFGCSETLRMSVGREVPPVFTLHAWGNFLFFTISLRSGEVIWKLYPKRANVSVTAISTVTYGVVPPDCNQAAPENSPPPPLIEGEIYFAAAMATDSPGSGIRFKIKDGKVLEIPD